MPNPAQPGAPPVPDVDQHPAAPKILVQVRLIVASVLFPAPHYPTLLGTVVLYHASKAVE